MAAKWIETITGPLEQKKQYRQYKARIEALPEPYRHRREGARALRHYLRGRGHRRRRPCCTMFDDLADLWERAAADGTPVRDIVGADPVEFAETFASAYTGARWIDKERARLTKAIDDAETSSATMTAWSRLRTRRSGSRAWRSRSRS